MAGPMRRRAKLLLGVGHQHRGVERVLLNEDSSLLRRTGIVAGRLGHKLRVDRSQERIDQLSRSLPGSHNLQVCGS